MFDYFNIENNLNLLWMKLLILFSSFWTVLLLHLIPCPSSPISTKKRKLMGKEEDDHDGC